MELDHLCRATHLTRVETVPQGEQDVAVRCDEHAELGVAQIARIRLDASGRGPVA
jgi:hypothetical protein